MKDLEWHSKAFKDLTNQDLYNILMIRQAVFVVEQNCPYQDCDGLDEQAIHIYGIAGNNILAYARVFQPGITYKEASIGRILTSQYHRDEKLGYQLVRKCIDYISKHYPSYGVRISGQCYAMAFYEKLGFKAEGDTYLEDDIPHIELVIDKNQMP